MTNEKAAYIGAFLFLIVQQSLIRSIDIWGQLGATLGGIVNLTIDGQIEPATPSCLCAHRFLPVVLPRFRGQVRKEGKGAPDTWSVFPSHRFIAYSR